MSVQDIVKYVIKTPGNTNPNVIKSMVEDEMNTTLEMAKAYTDSQRLAYVSYVERSLKYDGDPTDKTVVSGIIMGVTEESGINYVRIADNVFRGDKVTNISLYADNALLRVWEVDQLSIVDNDGVFFVYTKNGVFDDYPAVIFFPDEAGVGGAYVWDGVNVEGFIGAEHFYIGSVSGKFAETIHPIDPKFLPGMCLPVVELSEDQVIAIIEGEDALVSGGTGLSYSEGPLFEQFENLYNNVMPCVLRFCTRPDNFATILSLEPNSRGHQYSARTTTFDFYAVRTFNDVRVWELKIIVAE